MEYEISLVIVKIGKISTDKPETFVVDDSEIGVVFSGEVTTPILFTTRVNEP